MPEELEDKERIVRLKVVEQKGSEKISCEVSKVWLRREQRRALRGQRRNLSEDWM